MWRADPRRAWLVAIAGLLLVALALRVWGFRHGLPFIYNADENAHFVARAIGMFGHSYNPHYFINPPGFTYLLHVLFWLRWGSEGVQATLAADPGAVFGLARLTAAALGTLSVGLLLVAGSRLFDRATGWLAGALLAVAFLPVHYSHLALNDVPTLAALCLALVGAAQILRRGRPLDYVVAGAGLGLACATKYTAGIVLLSIVAAALASARPETRVRGLLFAGLAAGAAFLVANPFALLDFDAFRAGLSEQSSASNDGGGKLGLTHESGLAYYLWTLTWGLGWIPLAAAAGGTVALLIRDRPAAWLLLVPIVVFLVFMGSQDRYFARWLLPVYPMLCLLAASGAVSLARLLAGRLPRRLAWAPLGLAAAALCAQGLLHAVHNDVVLSRDDTRQLARDWMVRNVPAGAKIVAEPVSPDQWAMDPGRPRAAGNGNRWNKWPTSRSLVRNDGSIIRSGRGRVVKLEDYERTTRPELVDSYARGGYCWVLTGSTQYGRAFAEPEEVPRAIAYYRELARRGEVVFRASPYARGAEPVNFSFDFSFNFYPLAYQRPGPEIVIYRLTGGACDDAASLSS